MVQLTLDEWIREARRLDPRMTLSFRQTGGGELAAFFKGRPEFGEFHTEIHEVVMSPQTPYQAPGEVEAVLVRPTREPVGARLGVNSGNSGEGLGSGAGSEAGGWFLVLVVVVLVVVGVFALKGVSS